MNENSELQTQQGAARGAANYRQQLRAGVRGLWTQALSFEDAWDVFDISIRNSFTRAYHGGAKESSVLPSELTPQEKMDLRRRIQRETNFIAGFLEAIENGSKANGGKLGPLYKRIEKWVQRYQEVYTAGQMTARDDPKYRWLYSHTVINHCVDCERLHNQVRRKSVWERHDLQPQSPRLSCMVSARGITVCECQFEPTTDRATPGPLPRVR